MVEQELQLKYIKLVCSVAFEWKIEKKWGLEFSKNVLRRS